MSAATPESFESLWAYCARDQAQLEEVEPYLRALRECDWYRFREL